MGNCWHALVGGTTKGGPGGEAWVFTRKGDIRNTRSRNGTTKSRNQKGWPSRKNTNFQLSRKPGLEKERKGRKTPRHEGAKKGERRTAPLLRGPCGVKDKKSTNLKQRKTKTSLWLGCYTKGKGEKKKECSARGRGCWRTGWKVRLVENRIALDEGTRGKSGGAVKNVKGH